MTAIPRYAYTGRERKQKGAHRICTTDERLKRMRDLLGGIPRQHISNMERGARAISVKTARKLAEIFGVSPDKFI